MPDWYGYVYPATCPVCGHEPAGPDSMRAHIRDSHTLPDLLAVIERQEEQLRTLLEPTGTRPVAGQMTWWRTS